MHFLQREPPAVYVLGVKWPHGGTCSAEERGRHRALDGRKGICRNTYVPPFIIEKHEHLQCPVNSWKGLRSGRAAFGGGWGWVSNEQ